jgi:hypothetical protein
MMKLVCLAMMTGTGLVQSALGQVTLNNTFTITGVNGNNLGGVYTDPYIATVNNGIPLLVFCDDFTDNVSLPETWNANGTDLSAFNGSTPVSSVYFGIEGQNGQSFPDTINGVTYTQTQEYIAAAILVEQGLNSYQTDPQAANDYSFALWGIFDPGLLYAYQTSTTCTINANAEGCLHGNDLTNAQSDLTAALNLATTTYTTGSAYESATGSTVEIYSAASANGTVATGTRPQEFITVQMSEAPPLGVLAADLMGIGVLCYFIRRRMVASR